MKKILALVLVLILVLSLVACGEKDDVKGSSQNPPDGSDSPVSTALEISEPVTPSEEAEAGVCTPEAYDNAIDTLYISTGFETMPTYDDVVEVFGGVQGAVYSEFEYEGYSYYTWTDGSRTAILTFSVSDGVETYYAISGDLS